MTLYYDFFLDFGITASRQDSASGKQFIIFPWNLFLIFLIYLFLFFVHKIVLKNFV